MSFRGTVKLEIILALACVLALLLAVMSSPIRPSCLDDGSASSNCLPRNFAITSTGKARLLPTRLTNSSPRASAILTEPTEDEKELIGVISRVFSSLFNAPPTPSPHPTRATATLAAVRAILHPLRC